MTRCSRLLVLRCTPGHHDSPDGLTRTEYHRCTRRTGHVWPHRFRGQR